MKNILKNNCNHTLKLARIEEKKKTKLTIFYKFL